MSCVDEIFVGDIGTSIEFLIKECDDSDPDNPVEVLVDVSTATAMQIIFLKQDASTLVVTNPQVRFLTNGEDSIIHYFIVDGDIDQAGYWEAQLKVTLPTGVWYTSKINFTVSSPIVAVA